MNKKMPTPETQDVFDVAYQWGLNGEDPPPLQKSDEPTVGEAMANLAQVMGYAAGLNEHYKRKGIRTQFFND